MKSLIVDCTGKKITPEKLGNFIDNERISNPFMLMKEPRNDWYAGSTTIKKKGFFHFNISGLVDLIGKAKRFRKYRFKTGYVLQNNSDYESMAIKSALLLFMVGFFLKSSGVRNIRYLNNELENTPITYRKSLAWALLCGIKLVFAPFIMIIKSPYTFYKEILMGFLLAKEDDQDEIIGYGPYIKFSGHVYFKIRMKMINRVGLFGIMIKDYFGVPLTLHRSPLDGYLAAKIGYRAYVALSAILMSLAFSWIIIASETYELFLVVPLIFISPYFIKTIYIGHLEPFAWVFLSLSLVSFIQGHLWLSALFLGFLVLTHIGIALLNTAAILMFYGYNFIMDLTMSNLYSSIFDLLIYGIIVLAMSICFIIPFLRTRDKLSRNELINKYYGWAGRWNFINGLQAALYIGFFLLALYLIPITEFHLMLLIPFATLFINTRIRWLWSAYTIEQGMLIIGAIFILLNPNYLMILMYLVIIFTSPILILNGFHGITATEIRIRPIRLGNIRKKIIELVSVVPDDERLAFEAGPMDKTRLNYDYNSHLCLLLLDEKFEMMDAYAPEIVDACIFTDIVYHLYSGSTKDVLDKAMKNGGAGYIMVYDPKFKDNLRKFGYEEMGTADCTEWTQFGEAGPIITLFKVPFETSIIEPATDIKTGSNEISFEAKAGSTYLLRYGYYIGWRAHQDGERLPIEEAKPGMRITTPKDGTVTLKFQFKNFLLKSGL